jgi:hypothetical protein
VDNTQTQLVYGGTLANLRVAIGNITGTDGAVNNNVTFSIVDGSGLNLAGSGFVAASGASPAQTLMVNLGNDPSSTVVSFVAPAQPSDNAPRRIRLRVQSMARPELATEYTVTLRPTGTIIPVIQ